MSDRAKSRLSSPSVVSSKPITARSISRLHKTPLNSSSPATATSNHHQKVLIWQIIIFFGTPILIGIVFAVFILPILIKVTGAAKMSQTTTQAQTFVPQAPILNVPPEYIDTTTLTISGFAEPNHTVTILLDGKEVSLDKPLVVATSGEFSTDLSLSSEGEYSISAYSTDPESKQTSPTSPTFYVTVDLTIPTLAFDNLTPNQEIVGKDKQTLVIAGTTEPQAKIYLNDRLSRADAEGKFNIRLELTEGDNTLNFVIEDEAGNKMEHQLAVKFTP